jgi:hypothetical protein
MNVIVQRTTDDRQTDMYVIRFSPPKTRFICFCRYDFEQKFPHIKLGRGEKIICKMGLTLGETEV